MPNLNLVLAVVGLWLAMSITEGCRNRPKPFQDFTKRWREYRQQRMDDRRHMPQPIDNERDQNERGRMFRDRKRLLPIREDYTCEI